MYRSFSFTSILSDVNLLPLHIKVCDLYICFFTYHNCIEVKKKGKEKIVFTSPAMLLYFSCVVQKRILHRKLLELVPE